MLLKRSSFCYGPEWHLHVEQASQRLPAPQQAPEPAGCLVRRVWLTWRPCPHSRSGPLRRQQIWAGHVEAAGGDFPKRFLIQNGPALQPLKSQVLQGIEASWPAQSIASTCTRTFERCCWLRCRLTSSSEHNIQLTDRRERSRCCAICESGGSAPVLPGQHEVAVEGPVQDLT